MNKTANFQLTQWEKTDRIMMEDFNRDNAAIDAALKSNADKAAALQTALAGAGNCSIEIKSYTGTGKNGKSNPTRITFSKKPKAVLICGYGYFLPLTDKCGAHAQAIYSSDRLYIEPDLVYSWSGSTLQFYSDRDFWAQGNVKDYVYQVIAFY